MGNNIESNIAFSSERFSSLLKSDFIVNKGNYIKYSIATIGVFIALASLISINAVIDINSLKHLTELTGRIMDDAIRAKQLSYGSMYLALSSWILCIGLTVCGSLTFSNFSSKKKRISSLMIPASRSEKFLLQVLIYFVGGTFMLIIGLLLGLLICQITFGGGSAPINSVFEFLDKEFSGSLTIIMILVALFGNSLYALGSSLWPKLSWIKTWVILMVVQWAFTAIFMILAAANINWDAFFTLFIGLGKDNMWILIWSGITILAILNLVCWGLAWLRFKNTQIIQRFMTK
ncbi:MAG: hypothetical protein K2L45_04565 [Muribaculaceae bacterium]|nr:hypothetical protein [Muribaculaceae bacterium]MDE6632965.1 hypothetical protein [Muribaculaceae bacterium]